MASAGDAVVIRRVVLRNFKSIAACDVKLGRLSFLVGPNGAGKSNFLRALSFVADSLRTSLDHALRGRGSIKEVRRRSGGRPNHFSLRVDFSLPGDSHGHYSFRIGAKPNGGYEVQHEECRVTPPAMGLEAFFAVKSGRIVASSPSTGALPAALPDRLMLVAASGHPVFRRVYDALSAIEVYNPNPQQISALQDPDPGNLLRHDGSNAASVLQRLDQATALRINSFLSRIVPGVQSAHTKTLGPHETIEFLQHVKGQQHPWHFLASSMSDGTLRALAVLLAINQRSSAPTGPLTPSLIGLEEPETALHPAASSILLAALRVASRQTQILVTSHSPDLLDNPDIDADSVYAVENIEGVTRIGPLDDAGRQMLRESLFTAGELLRQNQLAPAAHVGTDARSESQLGLFEFDRARV